ncbi:hypothetical protein JAAARDRAFT_188228 [Jaapia argillacea MUCL 33604]|uniref:RlpA-like protein double-psi beta-barrel domain-containing protein n=1 Tax=Jaapia argillacea MUCL 33604 TaxID=933084 RepID=A0A067QFP0_9AGAM|nr:hypothetical protein JAAARDRAFT_188228 [Jaapia argillacea MUCL 33604]
MFLSIKSILSLGSAAGCVSHALAFQGRTTWFYPGLGACGAYSSSTDHVVALSSDQFANGAHCYKHIGVWYGSNYVDATIVDLCPSCGEYDLDLSPSAFGELANLDVGVISAGWYFE